MLGLQFGVIVVCIAAISTNDDHSGKPSSSNCTTHITQCQKKFSSQALSNQLTCGLIETFVGCTFHSGCDVPAGHHDKWAGLLRTMMDSNDLSCSFSLARLINPDTSGAGVTRCTSTMLVVASTLPFLLRAFFHPH